MSVCRRVSCLTVLSLLISYFLVGCGGGDGSASKVAIDTEASGDYVVAVPASNGLGYSFGVKKEKTDGESGVRSVKVVFADGSEFYCEMDTMKRLTYARAPSGHTITVHEYQGNGRVDVTLGDPKGDSNRVMLDSTVLTQAGQASAKLRADAGAVLATTATDPCAEVYEVFKAEEQAMLLLGWYSTATCVSTVGLSGVGLAGCAVLHVAEGAATDLFLDGLQEVMEELSNCDFSKFEEPPSDPAQVPFRPNGTWCATVCSDGDCEGGSKFIFEDSTFQLVDSGSGEVVKSGTYEWDGTTIKGTSPPESDGHYADIELRLTGGNEMQATWEGTYTTGSTDPRYTGCGAQQLYLSPCE